MRLLAVLLLLLLSTVVATRAADMSVLEVSQPEGAGRYLRITGDIELGDWRRFVKLLAAEPGVRGVWLESDGGSADDGLAIAKHVYTHRMDTLVRDAACHSVCAVIFLAGANRYMTADARLTVHSAYKELAGWVVEDDIANGTVAWFIGHMGYPVQLARLWVSTDVDSTAAITPEMNERWKLGFTVIE